MIFPEVAEVIGNDIKAKIEAIMNKDLKNLPKRTELTYLAGGFYTIFARINLLTNAIHEDYLQIRTKIKSLFIELCIISEMLEQMIYSYLDKADENWKNNNSYAFPVLRDC